MLSTWLWGPRHRHGSHQSPQHNVAHSDASFRRKLKLNYLPELTELPATKAIQKSPVFTVAD